MSFSANLGFPRIGKKRELKRAVEAYWRGDLAQDELLQTAVDLRRQHWLLQKDAGIDQIPSNDFSLYDQVLDMCALVGAVPARYRWSDGPVDLDVYFAMARGRQSAPDNGASGPPASVRAMEMTKWFDTNYHYIVPELGPDQAFQRSSTKPVDEFREALELGIHTRPVLIGPLTFLLLAKGTESHFQPLTLLDRLLPAYAELLRELRAAGAQWVQIDEPCLALDRSPEELNLYRKAYDQLAQAVPEINLALTTYFAPLRENLSTAMALPVAALHLDVTRAADDFEALLAEGLAEPKMLSVGIVDGRNVWKTDLGQALQRLERAADVVGPERLIVAPSCSLLHCPMDLEMETELDPELKNWLAFGEQKLAELRTLTRALNEGRDAVRAELEANAEALASRRASGRIHNPAVKERAAAVTTDQARRNSPFAQRKPLQQQRLNLPMVPTTTIGSFPQTREVRQMRARHRRGEVAAEEYNRFIREEIRKVIALQEEVGLDVLVHGEFERNDMVQYFGEQLEGFAFTEHGWVQSYGSRAVKPPIIFGDVSRPHPMTVEWSRFAAARTERPMKGMLTGPVTILQWSFVRDDQPRAETCRQIALAIRDEVLDLEEAGLPIVQIDEPALREGLPLRRAEWNAYLEWAVQCFRLASGGVRDDTQIHTHMCYSEFNDIIEAIAALDADVISLEASRSNMELLDAFTRFQYPNDIGPGVYDIHSPRVPPVEEIVDLLLKASRVLRAEQLWVNPDCGLKTRGFDEVASALMNMTEAARKVREQISVPVRS